MKVCAKCGAREKDTMIFCSQCKEKLGEPISEEERALIEQQTGQALEKSYKRANPKLVLADVMASKLFKKIFLICIIVFAVSTTYWTVLQFGRVRVIGASMDYVETYRGYYHKVKNGSGTFFTVNFYKDIYFLPGQKGKMMKKIKQDVYSYLDKLIEENGDIFYKYEISDDFKRVRVYEASGDIDRNRRDYLGTEVYGRIDSLIGLYHNIKEGHSVATDDMFKIIKSSG